LRSWWEEGARTPISPGKMGAKRGKTGGRNQGDGVELVRPDASDEAVGSKTVRHDEPILEAPYVFVSRRTCIRIVFATSCDCACGAVLLLAWL
jgi:hypothetical protein